jgi:glucokinase
MVELRIKRNQVIAIDLGGTFLRVARMKGNKILEYTKIRTPKQKNKLLIALFDSISSLMTKNIRAIGISCVGPLENGIIKNPPNLALQNFNLKEKVKKIFNKRVEVENDANCVALAEAKLGVKKKNFIILTLGTGIGGGVIINGELYVGEGYGGELGHIVLDNKRDLEDLWKEHRRLSKKYFGRKLLIKELIKKKDRRAKSIINKTSNYLGQGIASLINVFDPEVVVLSGGVKETGGKFLDMVKKQAKNYIMLPRTTPIQWTKLEHPGILGAGLLVR